MKRRLYLTVVLAVVTACAAGMWLFFRLSRPVGSGPAGPVVRAAEFSRPWTTRPVLLVGLGDSVTAGFGARRGYGYFDRLFATPLEEFRDVQGLCLSAVLPGLRATNLAVSGSTSMDHIERQMPRLPIADSNVFGIIVLTTGGNDLIHNYGRTSPREGAMFGATAAVAQPWIENFELRLESILAGISSRFPGGCRIFLANIYDPTDGVGDIQHAGLPAWADGLRILTAYNDVIQRCAEKRENVHLVDLYATFLGHGIHCTQFWGKHNDSHDPHYWYHINLEDPNERGYDAIRRLFLIEMTKVASRLN